jgi:Amt family ammonium transporter
MLLLTPILRPAAAELRGISLTMHSIANSVLLVSALVSLLVWLVLHQPLVTVRSLLSLLKSIISLKIVIRTPKLIILVPVYVASLVGALTAICCFFANKYKYILSIDEGLDIFALHGVGGYVGDVLTGFFAASYVPALDGVSGTAYAGGWWNRNFKQMGYQLAAATVCAAWSFAISCILLFIINKIPGCHIRLPEDEELMGLDQKYLMDVEMQTSDLSGYEVTEPSVNVTPKNGGSLKTSQVQPVAVTEKLD